MRKNHTFEKIPSLIKILGFVIVAVACFIVGSTFGGKGNTVSRDGQTVKLKLDNIGELATQVAYCTEVESVKNSQTIFGKEIPFTESKQIYSYNVEVKAGYDFSKIEYTVDKKSKEIKVTLPEVKILSTKLDTDSFKIYDEQNSIFSSIDLDSHNKALSDMTTRAENDAIENGIYTEACENAETLLKGFFASEYDLNTYTITFKEG